MAGSGPKKPRYSQCPHFFWLKVDTSSVGKDTVLLNLERRKLKGLGELMCALNRVFGYKACVNRMFLNISRLLEITERERSELLLSVKSSQKLGSSPFPYIAPVISRPLPGEDVWGEDFVLVDLVKSISGSPSQVGSAQEP